MSLFVFDCIVYSAVMCTAHLKTYSNMGIFLPIKCKEHAHCMCANEKIKFLFNNLSLLLCAIFYITALNFATQHISVFAEFTQENEKPSIVFT